MTFSRIDLMGQSLPKAFRGYACTEVDRLLQDLSASLARMSEEKLTLANRLAQQEEALAQHRQREVALQQALVAAQRISEDIRDSAQKEAQRIMDTAYARAESILANAHLRLARVMEEVADAKKAKAQFELKLRSVIEGHLRLMELDRQESASLDAAAAKLANRPPEGYADG